MKVLVNGEETDVPDLTISELRDKVLPDSDITILNGRRCNGNVPLLSGDAVTFIRSPNGNGSLSEAMAVRDPPEVYGALSRSVVGIAGCGGLGSNIATFLVRSGIRKLVIADFDRVEPSNLNRQNYGIRHLGLLKCEALRSVLLEINPECEVETHPVRLDEGNIGAVFDGCDAICEAFDKAEEKAWFFAVAPLSFPDRFLVFGNGMGGIGDPSELKLRRLTENIAVCGDGSTGSENGLAAPRVAMCAAMMANTVIEELIERRKSD